MLGGIVRTIRGVMVIRGKDDDGVADQEISSWIRNYHFK